MKSELEAQLTQFIELWQSSKSLRLLIKQVVNGSNSEPTASAKIQHEELTQPRHSNSAKTLIDKRLISPLSIAEKLTQSYGGLDRKSLLALLEKYKAGKRDLAVYMLVRAWKKAVCSDNPIDVRLSQLTLDLLGSAVRDNRSDFFQEIARIIDFLHEEEYHELDHWNHDPGQWWQFQLLLYILEHPKKMYPMREFVKHFREEVGSNEMPTIKTLRSFCRSHGIMLDSTPGAPKKSKRHT